MDDHYPPCEYKVVPPGTGIPTLYGCIHCGHLTTAPNKNRDQVCESRLENQAKAAKAGRRAYGEYQTLDDNPYAEDSSLHQVWASAYRREGAEQYLYPGDELPKKP